MSRTPQEECVHFLSDMYSVEQQALAQLVSAPDVVKQPTLAQFFREHHKETEQQAVLIEDRLEALGASPSAIKNAVMKLGGKGFLLFARLQPETPGRLVAHAYSYEAMEWAGYQMLIRMAQRAGDAQTADLARNIAMQERAMMERLESGFDAAEQASHQDTPPDEMDEQLCKHLAEAHALEVQGMQLLKKSEKIAGGDELEHIYRRHLEETQQHARLIERRLDVLGSTTAKRKDAALALGAINWGLFFQAQSDTPAKLAAFIYAVEHLEAAAYELLKRSARRANDVETQRLCEHILSAERGMAELLATAFDSAVRVTLATV